MIKVVLYSGNEDNIEKIQASLKKDRTSDFPWKNTAS